MHIDHIGIHNPSPSKKFHSLKPVSLPPLRLEPSISSLSLCSLNQYRTIMPQYPAVPLHYQINGGDWQNKGLTCPSSSIILYLHFNNHQTQN
jgi:hypothetical protein